MKDLKGTKTEKNLWEAFAGESQAVINFAAAEYFANFSTSSLVRLLSP